MCLFILSVVVMEGCDTALTIGNRTIGVVSGQFLFTEGYLFSHYNYPFEKVWRACEEVIIEMKSTGVEKHLRISKGTINAVAFEEKIQIVVEYVSKEYTSVAIRIGLSGNNMASQFIHEKIAQRLLKSNVEATQK